MLFYAACNALMGDKKFFLLQTREELNRLGIIHSQLYGSNDVSL